MTTNNVQVSSLHYYILRLIFINVPFSLKILSIMGSARQDKAYTLPYRYRALVPNESIQAKSSIPPLLN